MSNLGDEGEATGILSKYEVFPVMLDSHVVLKHLTHPECIQSFFLD